LGEDFATLSPPLIDARSETSDFHRWLFFITIDDRADPCGRYSIHQLRGMPIPDVPGGRVQCIHAGCRRAARWRIILSPFDVTIATPLIAYARQCASIARFAFWMLFVMVVISGAIGFGLSRLALRPGALDP